ncbi:MFS transporter [Bartonella ancashensis]|uniref:Transport transmembrane protein n=1 Tax=Bartonella ancashensis TaxID=1318743 RepID=A0A0M4M6A8_9HYPH|nr:MFS transporter [Bartonella ancashensis]ALE03717.1 Transport transmembrane protein [Bartonella ancashensis]
MFFKFLCRKNNIYSLIFSGGVALHATNIYAATAILPSLIKDIGGEQYYSWAATILVVSSLISTSIATKILGATGPRNAYIIAILTFTVGTFICSLAHNMPLFLTGRLIQGFGGGFLLSLSYSIVRIVLNPPLWPRALGVISGMWGVSALLGPAIGGLTAQYSTWRAAFWIIGFLAIVFSLMVFKILPKKNKMLISELPLPITQLLVLTLLILVISVGSTMNAMTIIFSFITGIGLLFVLAKLESSSQHPMFPHKTFSLSSEFFPVYSLILIVNIVAYGLEFYLPLFFQELHKKGPLIAAYITALISLGWTCGSLLCANATKKNIRRITICSPVLIVFNMGILLRFIPTKIADTESTFVICISLFLMGISAGIAWPHLLTRILQCAQDKDVFRASESLTSIQLLSAAVGAAVAGAITNLAGLFNPGGIEGTVSAAKALFTIFTGVILFLGLPFSFYVSHKMLKKPGKY